VLQTIYVERPGDRKEQATAYAIDLMAIFSQIASGDPTMSIDSPPTGEAALKSAKNGGVAMAIIALEIKARQTLAGGREFGAVGPYLQLDGTAHFAIDPRHPSNRCIADVDLAPRDGDSRVRFAADLRILVPEDPRRSNHRLLFDVVNRGNRLALAMFNRVPRPITPSAPARLRRWISDAPWLHCRMVRLAA
jgi:hypothetical protein